MTRTSSILNLAKIAVLLLLTGFIFAQVGISSNHVPSIQKVQAASRAISLIGNYNGWNFSGTKNPTITVTRGDSVTVMLSSVDINHLFFVDVNNNGVADCTSGPDKCSSNFGPSSPTNFPFTIDFASGTYTYYCQYHPVNMRGSFIVQSPPPAPDFSLSITPAALTIAVGASGNFNVAVQSLNGFSGTVTITSSISPNSPSIIANPTSVNLTPGGTESSTLTVATSSSSGLYSTPTPNGAYTVTVTGTSGAITHTQTATANVGTSSSNPPSNNSTDPVVLGAGIAIAVLIAIIIGGVIYLRRRRNRH